MKKLVGITAFSMLLTLVAHASDMVCLEDVGGFDTLLVEKVLGPGGQVQDVTLLAFFESAQACQEKALTGKRPSNVITYNRSELGAIHFLVEILAQSSRSQPLFYDRLSVFHSFS